MDDFEVANFRKVGELALHHLQPGVIPWEIHLRAAGPSSSFGARATRTTDLADAVKRAVPENEWP